MKKLLLKSTAFLLCSISLSSQAQEWKKNSAHTALYALDQFGGTNITGIGIGIVNPTARLEVFGRIKFHSTLMLDSTLNIGSNYSINGLNGSFKNASWASASNRFMQVDATGSLIPFPVGSPSQVLYGNGTWGALPVVPVIWQQAGSATYYNNGFVGIGTNAPQAALDVVGDVKVSNNLYVGGGILISQKVEASSSMKTDTVHSTSGETKFTAKLRLLDKVQVDGATLLKSQFQVDGTSLFNGSMQTSGLNVTGNAYFNNTITAPQGLNLNGTNGFRFSSGGGTGGTMIYGRTVGGSYPIVASICAAQPQPYLNHAFGGAVQIFDIDPSGNYVAGSGLLTMQTWAGGSSIDASIGGNTSGGNNLLINYFCGNNTAINTGSNGGRVSMGKIVEIGMPITDANTNLNIKTTSGANTKAISIKNSIDNEVFYIGCDGRTIINTQSIPSGFPSSGLQINQNGTQASIGLDIKLLGNNIYSINTDLTVQNDAQTAIRVINQSYPTGANTRFQVKGNGATYIGSKIAFGNHSDALLSVYGKALFQSIYVNTSSSVWADYVFEKNYKLLSLTEVEAYYKEYKHLPDFKSAKEYEAEGVNVIETQSLLLKKVEELTIYVVELEKQIQQLQKSKNK